MGKFEEPNMGLPILGRDDQHWVARNEAQKARGEKKHDSAFLKLLHDHTVPNMQIFNSYKTEQHASPHVR